MRALFLTLYPQEGASARYRVLQYLPYLRANGIECTVRCAVSEKQYRSLGKQRRAMWYHLAETPRRLLQLIQVGRYDVVFLQKAVMTAYLRGAEKLLRKRAKRLIYDIDDAVHLAPPHPLPRPWSRLEDRDQVLRIMAEADLVIAGNEWLADIARAQGGTATVLPTVVDTDRFHVSARASTEYRVGWIGNPSTTPYLDIAAPALREFNNDELSLIGGEASRTTIDKAEFRPWSIDAEVEEMHRIAVGIMPLPKTDWVRGKCALKALLYMACGIPCVATPFGAVLDVIEPNANGLFADSPDDWRNALERLRDPVLRKRLGEAGRATVEKRFSLKVAAPKMMELLENVA